ncbi:DNA-binding protein SMUBP-2 [Zopfochytrium polystomum]|nr:DNA-binding protein SMUBP-2 [Zopfochytrium polystomum]
MAFPSKQLYGGKLIAHDSVKAHLLSDLPGVEATGKQEAANVIARLIGGITQRTKLQLRPIPLQLTLPLSLSHPPEDTTAPLLFFDTSTASHGELADDDDPTAAAPSLHNPGEAALVVAHVRALVAAGLAPSRIAIVSPYAAQTRRLALAVAADPDLARGGGGGVEVATVDALQGAERDAVVLSLVRSNARREVGFLRDVRRLNVAMTRARRQLAVIGDGRCLAAAADGGGVGGGGGAFLKRWVEFLEEVGEVRYVE